MGRRNTLLPQQSLAIHSREELSGTFLKVAFYDAVNHSKLQRFRSLHAAATRDEINGKRNPDNARQPVCAARTRDEPQCNFRQ
ncbi:MAG: hypothetical protein RIC82_06635, partial [Parvibaculum sp.]